MLTGKVLLMCLEGGEVHQTVGVWLVMPHFSELLALHLLAELALCHTVWSLPKPEFCLFNIFFSC